MSTFDQMPHLKASGNSFKSMENNVSVLKELFQFKIQFVLIQCVVLVKVILTNIE